MYDDDNVTVNCADNTTGTPFIKNGLFDKMAKRIYSDKGFKPEQLSEPEFVAMITDTWRVITTQLHQCTDGACTVSKEKKQLADSYIKQEISPELTAALEQNAFMFAGFKIFHEAGEIAANLKGDDGGFKPFSTFLKETKKIDETYNKHYLRAEYNFATQSTLSAVKWKEFEKDGDRYNLQYRTAGDDRVRDEHAALHNTTLPPSDPFWSSYYPPNGWNCRCTAVQVRKSKYPESDSAAAIAAGERSTTKIGKTGVNKAAIFRFNPGKEMKLMPPKHPYYPRENECKGCPYKKTTNLVFDNEKAICKVCRKTDAVSVKWSRDRVREHFKKTAVTDISIKIGNIELNNLTYSYKDIETITGKPHDFPYARNMAAYYIKDIAKQGTYLGYSDDIKINNPKHKNIIAWRYYSFDFLGSKSILIIKEYQDGSKRPHHIQDINHFKMEKIKYPYK